LRQQINLQPSLQFCNLFTCRFYLSAFDFVVLSLIRFYFGASAFQIQKVLPFRNRINLHLSLQNKAKARDKKFKI